MDISTRAGYFLQGSVELASATLFAVYALQNSNQDACFEGRFYSLSHSPPVTFNERITACSGQMFKEGKSSTRFSIPVSKLATLTCAASSLTFALRGIQHLAVAFSFKKN